MANGKQGIGNSESQNEGLHLPFTVHQSPPMDVGELLQWIEIHAGTDREVWQWWPGGLLCCVNGLACEVRYRRGEVNGER